MVNNEIDNKFRNHRRYIDNISSDINESNFEEILDKIYLYVKSVSNLYYDGNFMNSMYDSLSRSIYSIEDLSSCKIVDVQTNFNYNDDVQKENDFIKYLVQKTRRYILDKIFIIDLRQIKLNKNLDDVDLCGQCYDAAIYVEKICHENNIKSYPLEITPGYDKKIRFYGDLGLKYHYATIVKYLDKYFLVDTTYSQFFYTKNNSLNRIGIVGIPSCEMGRYMIIDEKRNIIAKELLEHGYIELNEDIFKAYMDGFTMSYRNGLYYESTNDFSYTTPYTIDDYIRFLEGSDNQVNHEGRENIGFQNRPLKDYTLDFKRNFY